MAGYKILIIGCGELGSRHLQAVSVLESVSEVCVLDPSDRGLELGQTRLAEVSQRNPKIQYHWLKQIDESSCKGDLIILATQAQGRVALVEELFPQLNYRYCLTEKVVAQSVEEYQLFLKAAEQANMKVWVNCKTRAYKVHQYIKSKLSPEEPIVMTRIAGNHGLGSNGIHGADLFAFFTGNQSIDSVRQNIDSVIHPSKRGNHVCDLSGHVYGSTGLGDQFQLSFVREHMAPDVITVMSSSGRFIVDHFKRMGMQSLPENNWEWMPLEDMDENWAVSVMTAAFVNDILEKDECALPTLQQNFIAHEFILNSLYLTFDQLGQIHNGLCPIT